ncbi:hypothetical protein LWI29_025518 [Acer saccharum]|uniref:Uncharacterized protein n=1 Tax=Acer saccharum TaxID=4024 RepID=A0AA39VLJ1_ACESA|nr:hypothetical protein LWI29_025518 [Acer saccharum]KAK1568883.1 hypothetical protein Q3G72_030044 [Acer saccharum]
MEEDKPPRVSRKDDQWKSTSTGDNNKAAEGGPTTRRKSRRIRYAVDDNHNGGGGGGGGDLIDCSGKYCRSCTAGLIADCVALCCCPCAVLNILALAFVKIPYKVGKRCLGLGKNKDKVKRKCKKLEGHDHHGFVVERDHENLRNKGRADKGILEIVSSPSGLIIDNEDQDHQEMSSSSSARFDEAEKVWLELYQVPSIQALRFKRKPSKGE